MITRIGTDKRYKRHNQTKIKCSRPKPLQRTKYISKSSKEVYYVLFEIIFYFYIHKLTILNHVVIDNYDQEESSALPSAKSALDCTLTIAIFVEFTDTSSTRVGH